ATDRQHPARLIKDAAPASPGLPTKRNAAACGAPEEMVPSSNARRECDAGSKPAEEPGRVD
ncbi:MAG TPA: hypothetical protein VIH68_02680, partial [Bacteroidota bacterium]